MLDSQTDIHCGSVLQQFSATNVYPGYRQTLSVFCQTSYWSQPSPLIGWWWLTSDQVSVSREVTLGVGTQVFGGTCGTISWQVRPQGGISLILCAAQRFLFTPSSVLFPPTFCVTQREEFSLLEEFSLGVFLLTESLRYLFFLVSDCWALHPTDRDVECSLQSQPLRHLPWPGDDLQSSKKPGCRGHWFYSLYSGTIQLVLLLVQKNVLFWHWTPRQRAGWKNTHVWGTVYFLFINIGHHQFRASRNGFLFSFKCCYWK